MFSEVTEICENPLYFCSWLAAHLARWKQNAAHRACVEIEVRRGSKDGQTSRLSPSKTCCLGENFCHKLWQGTPGSLVSFWRPIFASVEFVHQNRTALKFFSWQLCMPELSDVSKDDWLTNLYFIELELSFHNHPLIVELLFVFFSTLNSHWEYLQISRSGNCRGERPCSTMTGARPSFHTMVKSPTDGLKWVRG